MKHRPSRDDLQALQKRYAKAGRQEKGIILDEFTQTTGYHRDYAIRLLRGDYTDTTHPIRHPRARYYTPEDAAALLHLWELLDGMCSQLLVVEIPLGLPQLRRDGELDSSEQCAEHLLTLSPATIERLLAKQRPRGKRRRGLTKPGTLKAQVPVRTLAERPASAPGFLDMDTVDHSGGNASGEFAYTLDTVDAYSQWGAMGAIYGKGQQTVLDELQRFRLTLPFPLRGLHSDSGAEFINAHLKRYCDVERLRFTRGRAGKKNDNAWIEHKNWSVVRRWIGYGRYDTRQQVEQRNRLYALLVLYINFFKPVPKLLAKPRVGSKVKKVYDEPKTPYQRLMECPTLDPVFKQSLQATYECLRVAELKRELDRLVAQLKPSRVVH